MPANMVGGGNLEIRTDVPRQQGSRNSMRKVPGGFNAEDEDDLSPTKSRADQHDLWNERSDTVNPSIDDAPTRNHRKIPSLNLVSMPSLPPSDSSPRHHHQYSDMDAQSLHMDTIDEQAMRRHLGDIESSFLPPPPSPLTNAQSRGADDTFLFDGARPRDDEPHAVPSEDDDEAKSSSTDPHSYQTPHVTRRHTPEVGEASNVPADTTSSLETMSSSPTAAAAARTISRALSNGSIKGYQTANEQDTESQTDEDMDHGSASRKTRRKLLHNQDSDDERSTIRNHNSSTSLHLSARHAGSTPGAALKRKSSSKRPKYLRSRNASQRSSISSFLTSDSTDDHSDLNLGADYALQSGGAVPAGGMSRTSSYQLSRQVSLGSIASGFENDVSDGRTYDQPLATLEEERNRSRPSTATKATGSDRPETPRAPSSQALTAPTDTVIARHVKNVQVPDSVAKEYANRTRSPSKNSNYSSTLGRNGKNMTLKEQSSTIERLSKENFDLKLKVMFLSDRLDKLSEEGVKETISENVELKTALANLQRDNKALRKKNKELEQKAKDGEGRPSTAKSVASSDERGQHWYDQEGAQEREEELFYLRERVEEYVTEIEKLRNEALSREAEKRRMAETVKAMGDSRGESFEAREEMDVWRDLLEQESARREQAEEDSRKLREDLFKIKSEISLSGGAPGLNHTTNIYNITKKRQMSPSRPQSEFSDRFDDRNGAFSAASTLLDDLRRESEQLRHENAELRREVGAQTSMLTSRNREKERLYQEIEDLKLGQRKGGGSIAGDSILERSASRAHERSNSRTSGKTKLSSLDEAEREEYENQTAELRDKINDLRLKNQELQQVLSQTELDFESHLELNENMEAEYQELANRADELEADIQSMQAERDDALRGQNEVENEFETLKVEAQETLDEVNAECDTLHEEIERLQAEINDKTENFAALQTEMRSMSDGLLRLEDDQDAKIRRIQELENEVDQNNREFEELQRHLKESNEKVERLQVQQENNQGEISFLRNEQESVMVKIGELEFSLNTANEKLQEEVRHVQELEQQIESERGQFDAARGKDKDKVHVMINSLNREVQSAKDEARNAHKKAQAEERESAAWKARLQELEDNLGEALGNLHGTRASLLKSVENLQREMETTSRDLEQTRNKLNEKDRLLKQRDSLLEAHGLEARKMVDLLDKERQSHRSTKQQFDTFQRQNQHTSRSIQQQESRMLELETSRAAERKKLTQLENSFKDQLTERNNLLLMLWTRLSAVCGTDWTHGNSLINGRALPTLEAVATMLPGFAKNLFAAIKTIESIVGSFKNKVKAVERDMTREYSNLENTLEARIKKLDRLEIIVKSGNYGISNNNKDPVPLETKAELAKLKEANRSLQAELASSRNVDNRTRNMMGDVLQPSPFPSVPTGPSGRSKIPMAGAASDRASILSRRTSSNELATIERVGSNASNHTTASNAASSMTGNGGSMPGIAGGSLDEAGEQRWIFRLRELERRLKAEREARLQDRSGAQQRLLEVKGREDGLRAELERERVRREGFDTARGGYADGAASERGGSSHGSRGGMPRRPDTALH